MRKILFTLFIAAFTLAACQEIAPVDTLKQFDILSAKIGTEFPTKTELDKNYNVLWSANDCIMGYIKSSFGYKYQVKPEFAGKSYANFSKTPTESNDDLFAGIEWDHIVAYYPYDEGLECCKGIDGYTLQDLIDAIDKVCRHYNIRHVPLSKSKICTLENVKDVMIDGLHPSREVRPLLALELLELSGY